jgi:hypothetical protein
MRIWEGRRFFIRWLKPYHLSELGEALKNWERYKEGVSLEDLRFGRNWRFYERNGSYGQIKEMK